MGINNGPTDTGPEEKIPTDKEPAADATSPAAPPPPRDSGSVMQRLGSSERADEDPMDPIRMRFYYALMFVVLHEPFSGNNALVGMEEGIEAILTPEQKAFRDLINKTTQLDLPPEIDFLQLYEFLAKPRILNEQALTLLSDFWRLAEGLPDNTSHVSLKDTWHASIIALTDHWTTPTPRLVISEEIAAEVRKLLQNQPLKLTEEFNKALLLTVTPQATNKPLTSWKTTDKALRTVFFQRLQNFIRARRLYLEVFIKLLLLTLNDERPLNPDDKTKLEQSVLVARKYYRMLRVTDTAIHAIAVAKGLHHNQPRLKMRKKTREPYIVHPIAVLLRSIEDFIMPQIENGLLPKSGQFKHEDSILLILVAAFHDLVEDTNLLPQDLIADAAGIIDKWDTALSGNIAEIKNLGVTRSVIDVFGKITKRNLTKILSVLSKNYRPSDKENAQGIKNNLFGENGEASEPSKTWAKYKEEHDPKLKEFLIKLKILTEGRNQQIALIVKMEDRTDNLLTMEGLKSEYQLRNIRAALTRLAAWAMLDHDRENYPLYGALPRLLQTIICQYERLHADPTFTPDEQTRGNEQDFLQSYDQEYLAQARAWLQEISS